MDMKGVYDFISYFEQSSLAECNLEIEGVKLGLKKNILLQTDKRIADTVGETADIVKKSQPDEKTAENHKTSIKAPLVGTFYRAGAPGEEPFVTEGQQVKAGDVIGIIEAMKMMNEIVAPADGRIERIVVENGDMVDYDKVLMYLTK